MMIKSSCITLIILLLTVISFDSNGQDSILVEFKQRRNCVYFELFGSGVLYSVNFERILIIRNKHNIAIRGGLSVFPTRNNNHVLLPIETNYFVGKKHCLEWGLGLTFEPDLEKIASRYNLYGYVRPIGYRCNFSRNRLYFRAGILIGTNILFYQSGDFISLWSGFYPTVGIGLGFKF